jgi:hypothetical protein
VDDVLRGAEENEFKYRPTADAIVKGWRALPALCVNTAPFNSESVSCHPTHFIRSIWPMFIHGKVLGGKTESRSQTLRSWN